jgi:HD superfamily phosphodiesterase
VAARACSLAPVLGADADLLDAAAWLHDIGYAPRLATTGLHALDGARYLRDTQHADTMLCRLVAHHTCAIIEAEERGLADILSLEFEPAPQILSSALTYCDITTSPDGEHVTAEQRLAEIQQRYGTGHLVSRSIQRATPIILRAVEQVQVRAARSA